MIPSRYATKDEILLVHSEKFYNYIESSKIATKEQLRKFEGTERSVNYSNVNSFYFENKAIRESIEFQELFDNALLAAGSCLNMVDAIMNDTVRKFRFDSMKTRKYRCVQGRNGFAIIRPPGHHSHCAMDYGFCYFNNVAICARYLQKQYKLKR